MTDDEDNVCRRVSEHIFEIGVEECGSTSEFFKEIAPYFGIDVDDFEVEDESIKYLKEDDWEDICDDLQARNRRVMSLAHKLNEKNEDWTIKRSLEKAWSIASEKCPNF